MSIDKKLSTENINNYKRVRDVIAPRLGSRFELESACHFIFELGGQYHWNLHFYVIEPLI
jgi:hypothetical protein